MNLLKKTKVVQNLILHLLFKYENLFPWSIIVDFDLSNF